MNQLPEEHKPISGSSGAIIRKKLLEKQLPVHDLDFNECHELSPGEINKMNEFVNKCKEHVGVGQIYEFKNQNISLNCTCCTNPLKYGDVVIFTKHSSNETFWHPQCFSCSKCNDRLVDLIYFHDKGEVFCGRHFAEISCDRCAACDELIFTDAYTKAEGKNWHIKHFCCYNCDKPLAGKNYVVSENGYPACVECLSKKCASCLGFIHVSMKRISLNNMHWHAANDCFKCSACHIPLLGDRFLIKDNFIFCSVNCKKVQYPN
ncbi:Testin [Nymphon striatum]|nr:Testin [Nymphon striatum]